MPSESAPNTSDSIAILFLSRPVNCKMTSKPSSLIPAATSRLDNLGFEFGESVTLTASATPTSGKTISTLCLRFVDTAGVVSDVKIKSVVFDENIIFNYC